MFQGVCIECGEGFEAKSTKKKYCTMECYVSSDTFKEMIIEKAVKKHGKPPLSAAMSAICLECGVQVRHSYPSNKPRSLIRQYCGKVCKRAWYNQRFDRFVANPETVSLPQCFDGFLDRDVLSCPFDRCEWSGVNLSTHANKFHGCPAPLFKRLVGFNAKTGLVGKAYSKHLSDRLLKMEREGIISPLRWGVDGVAIPDNTGSGGGVYSLALEGKEHWFKSRAVITASTVEKICIRCHQRFDCKAVSHKTKRCKDCTAFVHKRRHREGYSRKANV